MIIEQESKEFLSDPEASVSNLEIETIDFSDLAESLSGSEPKYLEFHIVKSEVSVMSKIIAEKTEIPYDSLIEIIQDPFVHTKNNSILYKVVSVNDLFGIRMYGPGPNVKDLEAKGVLSEDLHLNQDQTEPIIYELNVIDQEAKGELNLEQFENLGIGERFGGNGYYITVTYDKESGLHTYLAEDNDRHTLFFTPSSNILKLKRVDDILNSLDHRHEEELRRLAAA